MTFTASRRNLSHAPILSIAVAPLAPTQCTSLLDRLAEQLAEGRDIAEASASIRVPVGTGQALFQSICRRLGCQAK